MHIDHDALTWIKAKASGENGACVEIAHLADGRVALRDTKDRSLAPHVYTAREWDAFLDGARKGEFDRPVA